MIQKFFTYTYAVTFLVLVTTTITVGGAGWLVYDLQKGRSTLSELEFAYESAVRKSEYSSSVRTLLRDIENERVQLYDITENSDPVEIIRFLENAGETARVSVAVSAVNPGGTYQEDPSLASLLVALHAEDTFQKLYHFISLVETAPLPLILEQVKFEKREQAWSADVVVRVFFEEDGE
jgi:hypothetical protein